ncbi:MAG: bifunctional glutamate N-acetyltransferase/amino-acid acetyltransferase ArgJ [Acutalibacteraceae bacterium]|nr:bifunctional glutamate N-acetyltransferase/amino-acid acetyltransferase ArgJ [Clostridia bacterium]MEE3449151.1 bifunctional glutamate N-acetyltransferase/amino-acid acetyltransferase ArgJ [Acutalibacteraceae bacterium]
MNFIENGTVTSPVGFKGAGICGSVKPSNTTKKDIALISSDVLCNAAAVFTKNLVKSSAIIVTQRNLQNGKAQAVVVNSGNANTCNADGEEKAERMCSLAAQYLGIDKNDVIAASTGVIGQPLPIEPFEKSIPVLAENMSENGGTDVAEAIMTTDTVKKEAAVQVEIDGKTVTIGAVAKGSGMIHINMGTMLSFVTTDAAVSAEMLKAALVEAVEKSYNMVSVDGDTSTNDTLAIMANGLAGNNEIVCRDSNYKIFTQALTELCKTMAKKLAADGEGATKLLVCSVNGAKTDIDAKGAAKSVICSSLVKAAMFGSDANWGRVLCAIGYSGCDIDVSKVDVSFISKAGKVDVCKNGAGIEFDEDIAKTVLSENEITIDILLNDGKGSAEAYGCDLTYDYVKINGDYRT